MSRSTLTSFWSCALGSSPWSCAKQFDASGIFQGQCSAPSRGWPGPGAGGKQHGTIWGASLQRVPLPRVLWGSEDTMVWL